MYSNDWVNTDNGGYNITIAQQHTYTHIHFHYIVTNKFMSELPQD